MNAFQIVSDMYQRNVYSFKPLHPTGQSIRDGAAEYVDSPRPHFKAAPTPARMWPIVVFVLILTLFNTSISIYVLVVQSDFASASKLALLQKYVRVSETPARTSGSVSIGRAAPTCTADGWTLCVSGQSNFSQSAFIGDSLTVGKELHVTGSTSAVGRVSSITSTHSRTKIETPLEAIALWRLSSTQINAISDDAFKTSISLANTTQCLDNILGLSVQTFQWLREQSSTGYITPVQGVQFGLSSSSIPVALGSALSADVPNVDLSWQPSSTQNPPVAQLDAIDQVQVIANLVAAVQELYSRIPR